MNRKLNANNFQITELRLTNTVRHQWDDWEVTGLDLHKKLVQIRRTQGVEVLEKITPFKTLSPVPLWDSDNMLDPHIMRKLGFENVDSWVFRKGQVTVQNRFPATHKAECQTPGSVKMIFFLHELENILIDQNLCNSMNSPLAADLQ